MSAASPGTREVHVWRVDLPEGDHERRRAHARASLRRVLAEYLGIPGDRLELVEGPYGKPRLASEELGFNLSYSGKAALVAITSGRAVGVDVERVQPARAFGPIADRLFAPEEAAMLRRLAPRERVGAFFRLWTRKEAYLKATGSGLSVPLRRLPVLPRLETPDAEHWHVSDLDVGPGLAAALCVRAPAGPVRVLRLR